MKDPELHKFIQPLKAIARDVGSLINSIRQNYAEKPRRISKKKLITQADFQANMFWMERLDRLSPKYPIISEESIRHYPLSPKQRIWIVDPLDGTRDFSELFDGYVTQAALLEEGESKLCAIYHPESSTLFYTTTTGAFHDRPGTSRFPLTVSNRKKKFKLVTSRNLKSHDRRINESLGCEIATEIGSIGYKAARIASGFEDVCIFDHEMHIWDVLPIIPLVEKSGGVVTNLRGERIVYTGDKTCHLGVLISNGWGHDTLLERIQNTSQVLKLHYQIR